MDTMTDITLRLVFGLGIWLCGFWYLSRLLYARTAPLRHQVINHKPLRQAITLSETDRFIRDQEHELWPEAKLNHLNCAVCGPGPLLQGMVPSKFEHPFFTKYEEDRSDGYGTWQVEVLRPRRAADATMVSSAVIENGKYTGMHTLMLDLDYPVTLVESTTPGHHHLYADHQMTWLEYRGMLKAMANAGLIEHGYYRAAVRQRATMLRPPWAKKPPSELPAGKSSPVPKQLLNRAKWWKRWTG